MRVDPSTKQTLRKVGSRAAEASDDSLMGTVESMFSDHRKVGETNIPVLIDASRDVPWTDVVHVIDLCKSHGLDRIDFAAPYGN